MPIDTQAATAIVTFTGMGILCFNSRKKRAEHLLIHHGEDETEHKLSVEIFKPVSPADDESMTARADDFAFSDVYRQFFGYWYKRTTVCQNLDHSELDNNLNRVNLSIDISGEGDPEIDGFRKYQSKSFDRTNIRKNTDFQDFRWMVNVRGENLLGEKITPVTNTSYPVTKLFISNAEFFTASIAKFEGKDMDFQKVVDIEDEADESTRIQALKKARPFGKIADEIGARINADTVKLKIAVGNEEQVYKLPRIHRPYVICIKNNAAVSGSDMPVYRQFWNTAGKVTHDLITNEEIEERMRQSGLPVTAREMCNGVTTDDPPTIEPFI